MSAKSAFEFEGKENFCLYQTVGPGLGFVAYPEGIAQMPATSVWAVMFFFMLFTIELGSQVSHVTLYNALPRMYVQYTVLFANPGRSFVHLSFSLAHSLKTSLDRLNRRSFARSIRRSLVLNIKSLLLLISISLCVSDFSAFKLIVPLINRSID